MREKHFKTLMGMYRYCWRKLGKETGTQYAFKYARWVGKGYSIKLITK